MTNDLNPRDADGRVDDILDRALQQVASEDRGDVPWPADETTLAYLKGEANDTQREEVQAVLTASAEYRRFLTETEAMIRAVSSDSGTAAYDAVQAAGDRSSSQRADGARGESSWWTTLLRPVVWVPAAAVAALLIWFSAQPKLPTGGPEQIAFAEFEELDAADFVPFETRGAQPVKIDTAVAATAEDAALHALQKCITFDTETMTYTVTPNPSRSAPKVRTHYVALTLVDTTGRKVVASTSRIPATLPFDSTEISAWLMVPPSLILYKVRIPDRVVTADWPAARRERGCLTFSYRADGGFRATAGQVIEF